MAIHKNAENEAALPVELRPHVSGYSFSISTSMSRYWQVFSQPSRLLLISRSRWLRVTTIGAGDVLMPAAVLLVVVADDLARLLLAHGLVFPNDRADAVLLRRIDEDVDQIVPILQQIVGAAADDDAG